METVMTAAPASTDMDYSSHDPEALGNMADFLPRSTSPEFYVDAGASNLRSLRISRVFKRLSTDLSGANVLQHFSARVESSTVWWSRSGCDGQVSTYSYV